jgi:hypothetical protein
MNIAAYLVAGLVLAFVLGIWLHAITVWLFVQWWADMIAPLVPYLFLGSFFSLLLLALWILGWSHPASGEHADACWRVPSRLVATAAEDCLSIWRLVQLIQEATQRKT